MRNIVLITDRAGFWGLHAVNIDGGEYIEIEGDKYD